MTKETLLIMSRQEIDRASVIERVCRRELKQSKAAKMLNLSVRQMGRLPQELRLEQIKTMSEASRYLREVLLKDIH